MTTYYKFLTAEGKSPYTKHSYPMPKDDTPGDWVDVDTGRELRECEVGIHGCKEDHLLEWLDAHLYTLEYDGEVREANTKVYGRRARLMQRVEAWNKQTARLFAADCAERASRFWIAPAGSRWEPAQTIKVVRQFAFGLTNAAARDAARAAARDAATAAAWAAARDAARAAAWAAARDAATAAAWAAARDAARAAEREWQAARLMQYIRGEVDIEAIRAQVSS